MDNKGVGGYVRELRRARRIRVATLAHLSGVHRATLYRWEAEETQPRLFELEAVLKALGASQAEIRKALGLMDTPRACAQVRADVLRVRERSDLGPLPTGGHLLRAMRRRKGASVDEVAARVGISSRLLRYWENAEYWPSEEQLHALCYFLEATEEEFVALTAGPLPLGRDKSEPLLTEDEILNRLEQIRSVPPNPRLAALRDLGYLTLEAHAWQWATRHDAGRTTLSLVCSQYANYLFMSLRNAESSDYINRALETLGETRPQSDIYLHAVVRKASILGAEDNKAGAARAVKWLKEWLPEAQSRKMRAWMLSDMAHYLLVTGDTEQAVETGSEGLRIAEMQFANSAEADWRKRHHARLLAQAGEPEKALALLSYETVIPPSPGSIGAVSDGLTQVEIALAQKDTARTYQWLQQTYLQCERMAQEGVEGVPYCLKVTDRLREQLQTVS